MNKPPVFREILVTELKFLAFMRVRPDLSRLGNQHLGFALISAWLAGIGRYRDNPRADLWRYLGLGSVLYVFVMTALLWAIIKPLKPENWSYIGVVTFVGMTAPPALLYAIPVERIFTLGQAQIINAWLLAVAALWRVGQN
jgi:hypothetical protein